nr:reverse transcriptase domain-containing protein [Tanacetum cinerariifolium]
MVQNDEALEINLDRLEERREQAAIHEARSKAKMEKYYNSKLSIFDALVPIIEPLSAKNLVGKASISGVLTAVTTTTFIQTSSVPLILLADDRVLGAKQPTEVPSPSRIVFEKENWRLRQSILRLVKSVVAFFLVIPSLHRGRM